MTRVIRALSLAVPVAMAAAWVHVFGTTSAWSHSTHWIVSALVGAAALATIAAAWRKHATLHVAVAAFLLATQAAIIASTLLGARLIDYNLFPDRRLAIVIGCVLVVTVIGLACRRVWARWLGFALGAVSAVSGGLNAINYWSVTRAVDPVYPQWSMAMFLTTWVVLVCALGGTLVAINLAAPVVGGRFAANAANPSDATWTSDHHVVRWLRPMIVSTFAATPMLLVYAWIQPIVPQTQTTALVLAASLTLGAILAVRGKLIGALVLVAAGIGLVAQTLVTAVDAVGQRGIAAYYAVFWLPAGALAIACGIRLAGPTWRLLRRPL